MSCCRVCCLPLALLGILTLAGVPAAVGGELIPETIATRYGLTQAWFNQVQLDLGRGRIEHIVLHEGTLLITTNRAMLHAMDAETGQTLWVQQIGQPEHPTLVPSANRESVAVVNASQLYVLQRNTGKLLWKTQLAGVPVAGPALSHQRVYVPMLSGMVESYRLRGSEEPTISSEKEENGEKGKKKPTAKELGQQEAKRREATRVDVSVVCQSWGQATAAPIVVRQNDEEDRVAWPTDRGILFVGGVTLTDPRTFPMLYRMSTSGGIVGQPSYLPPHPQIAADTGVIILSSRDGFVYAAREKDGSPMWRFPTGEPILQPAVALDTRIYASVQTGGLYCLDAQKGTQLWWTPQIKKVVAASKSRLYASDKLGQLQLLDLRNGARLATLATQDFPLQLTNTETDRIYLASAEGLIQCLREIDLVQPYRHNVATPVTPKDEKPAAKKGAPRAHAEEKDAEAGEAKPAKKAAPRPARKPRPKKGEEGGDLLNNNN